MLCKPNAKRAGEEFFPEDLQPIYMYFFKFCMKRESVHATSHLQATRIQGDIWSRKFLEGKNVVDGRNSRQAVC